MTFIQQHLFIIGLFILVLIFCLFLFVGIVKSKNLITTKYAIDLDSLDPEFDGLKIAHLSDLHGNDDVPVFDVLDQEHVDLIICSGDVYDGVKRIEETTKFIQRLLQYAPVYFVSGNHEYYAKNWPQTKQMLSDMGVHVLDNQCEIFTINQAKLEICGIEDPDLDYNWSYAQRLMQFQNNLEKLPNQKYPRIFINHRADLFDELPENFADLVFSGHMHGGQCRLFNRGLFSPFNGERRVFLPQYTKGIYQREQMKMVVSCGLGDQMIVPRLFNPSELVLVTLHTKGSSQLCHSKESYIERDSFAYYDCD